MKCLPYCTILGLTCLPLTSFGVGNSKPPEGLDASLGINIASIPRYEGSKENRVVPMPLLDLNWHSLSVGTGGVSWQLVDRPTYGFGLTLGIDPGRKDKDTNGFLSQGSDHLRGMGEIKPTAEYGFRAMAKPFGLPVNLSLRKAPNNKGHGGTVIDIGTGLPLDLCEGIMTNVSLELTLADKNYMQSYFGVSSSQGARTSFSVYSPSAGLKSAKVGFDASYNFTKHWFVRGGVSAYRLLGDAAKSPIVERKVGANVAIGIGYHF